MFPVFRTPHGFDFCLVVFQFLCRFFKSENLARFLREREIMNNVWTEKVTTNRIEEERKDFDEFGAFVRNERL